MSGLITQQELCTALSKKIDDSDSNSKLSKQQIGVLTSLKTSKKDSLVNAINELYNNTINGKKLIADAIKELTGEDVGDDTSFKDLHDKIINSQSYPVTDAYLQFKMDFSDLKVISENLNCIKHCTFFEYNNKLYCFGVGSYSDSIQVMEVDLVKRTHKVLKMEKFDVNDITIDMHNNAVMYNKKFYYYQYGDKFIYDIETNTITRKKITTTNRVLTKEQRCNIGKYMYSFGCYTGEITYAPHKTCYRIDMETDECIQLPEPPYGFYNASPEVVGNKIYVVSSSRYGRSDTPIPIRIQVFDTVNNTWEHKITFNGTRNVVDLRTVLLKDNIYLFDLYDGEGEDANRCQVYNITNNSFTDKMRVPKYRMQSVFVYKNNIYLMNTTDCLMYTH